MNNLIPGKLYKLQTINAKRWYYSTNNCKLVATDFHFIAEAKHIISPNMLCLLKIENFDYHPTSRSPITILHFLHFCKCVTLTLGPNNLHYFLIDWQLL